MEQYIEADLPIGEQKTKKIFINPTNNVWWTEEALKEERKWGNIIYKYYYGN